MEGLYKFKVTVEDRDGNEMEFFIEVAAGNEVAASEMIQHLVETDWVMANIEPV